MTHHDVITNLFTVPGAFSKLAQYVNYYHVAYCTVCMRTCMFVRFTPN